MGDRVWLGLTIRGHIKNSRVLDGLCAALAEEGFQHNGWTTIPHGDLTRLFRADIIADAGACRSSFFQMDECNYANIDAVEGFLQQHAIAYHMEWSAGSEFSAGSKSCMVTDGKVRIVEATGDTESMISQADVRHCLEQQDVAKALRELLTDVEFADGKGLPEFITVGDDLTKEVAVAIATKALKVEA